MMFKCPVCHKRHTVPNNYDQEDYICQNTTNAKTFQDLTPTDQLTKNNYEMNRSSVLIDEVRPATIIDIKNGYRPTGEKIGQLKKNY